MDYQPEDRVARMGLAGMILNADGAEPLTRWERVEQNKLFWAGSAIAVIVGGYLLTVLIIRKRKAIYYRMDDKYRHSAVSAPKPIAANGHAVNGNGQPHTGLANGEAALRPNGGFQRNGHRRRKKRFSYHAFYSDMVMNLTRCNYVGSPGPYGNGQSANGDSPPPHDSGHNLSMPDNANLLVAETSKLIESQQKLIEGQRKLIEEQSKLIQEKSLLLNGETKEASKQSEALADQQLV